ncbi:MAG: S41 family peptidase [Bacteroidia bacterium]|nr:S41 family peptidase [Bacteroidia bacterium]
MKRTGILIISLFFFISSLILVGYDIDNFEISKNLDIFYTLFRELNIYYVDKVEPGSLVKKGIDEMLKSLDPYTVYYPESKIEEYKLMTTGQYGGIGALIRKSGEYVVVAEPYEDSPCMKEGLKAGDLIIELDGKTTKGKTTSDISEILKGQPNTSVKLTIRRPGIEKPINKTITREIIKIKSVPYYNMLNSDIGYIRFNQFTEGSSGDFKAAFNSLKTKNNIKGLIIDLRGNPGGLLIEAVHLCNIFVRQGQEIVSTKGKLNQWNNTYKAMNSPMDTSIAIVVLVNRGSASASEIVSGAMQDIDRGVILGERTYGKGLVQTSRQLSYNAQLKVTTAKYYIPSGRCIQALDYSSRNEDGSVGKIPDSLISEFKTKHERIVYDGGGIVPDIVQEPVQLSRIASSLLDKNLIFDFVTEYCLKHDSIPPPKNFNFTEDDYQEFVEYIKNKNFDYKTKSEDELKELVDITNKEKYYDLAKGELEALKQKLSHDKDKDLNLFHDEIKQLIKEEIVSRYYFQKGRIETILEKDKDVERAIQVLTNMEEYKAILSGAVEKKEGSVKK